MHRHASSTAATGQGFGANSPAAVRAAIPTMRARFLCGSCGPIGAGEVPPPARPGQDRVQPPSLARFASELRVKRLAPARRCPRPVAGRSLRTSCSSLARMPPALRHPACAWRHTPALGAWAPPRLPVSARRPVTEQRAYGLIPSCARQGRPDGRGTWRRSAGISVAMCVPSGTQVAGGIPKRPTEGSPPAGRRASMSQPAQA